MPAILVQAFLIFLFPEQRPFLDILYDSDKIFSAISKCIFAFYRETIGDDMFCDQSLVFKISKST